MIQTKEISGHDKALDTKINNWIQNQQEHIEILDIKYNVLPADSDNPSCTSALIIYKWTDIIKIG